MLVRQQMVPGAEARHARRQRVLAKHLIGARAGVWTLTANIRPARQPAAGEKEVQGAMTSKEVATAAQADTALPARGYSIPAGDRPCTMHAKDLENNAARVDPRGRRTGTPYEVEYPGCRRRR
jgi:hypothetical protein